MIDKEIRSSKFFKIVIVSFIFLTCYLPVILYNNSLVDIKLVFQSFDDEFMSYNSTSSKYLVASKKCKIPDINPFDPHIQKFYLPKKHFPCSNAFPLTYVSKINNTATLYIDFNVVTSYTINNVSCCYSNITRNLTELEPDNFINISLCTSFKEKVVMKKDFILVKCNDTKTQQELYENTHVAITVNKNVKKKIDKFINSSTSPYSVLFVGIDCVSRLNFIRMLPQSYQYLEKKGWLSLKGYNKIADNTFPNVMAILTGMNETSAFETCDPKKVDQLNKCPMIWYDYRKLGYITGYAEDETNIATFNLHKKGFTQPPTDYYFRPYMMATETLALRNFDFLKYCTGPEAAGERILNIAKDFVKTFKKTPTFSFYWMNSFSHSEKLNTPSRMDVKIKQFLKEISSDVLDNTFIFFLSDHGIRYGESRKTAIGWLEERLPFMFISVPERFKSQHPVEFKNFKNQQNKLTSPYDVYMTLQHILVLSEFNHTIKPSEACPKCRSLFMAGDSDRSCEDAGIEQHWCTCAGYSDISPDSKTVKDASEYILNQIHEIVFTMYNDQICAKYYLNKIIASSISETFSYKNDTYLLLVIETEPRAVFEATVLYKEQTFQLRGQISRLDSYSSHSACVGDDEFKRYCYCLD